MLPRCPLSSAHCADWHCDDPAGCYNRAVQKLEALYGRGTAATPFTVSDAFKHVVFHSPYNKLVQQSFQRILFNDAKRLAAVSE